MHPDVAGDLAEMRIEELRRQAAAYRLARRAARGSKAKRSGRKARRSAGIAPGRNQSCVECCSKYGRERQASPSRIPIPLGRESAFPAIFPRYWIASTS